MPSPPSTAFPYSNRVGEESSFRSALRCAILLLPLCISGCERLPRDPQKTLEHVREGRMRVGLVEHRPWVIRQGAEPMGVEVDLIRALAKELKATPEWHWGGEQEQMEMIEKFHLDLLAGGFTRKSPWRKTVGFTSGYYESPTAASGGKREDMA